MNQPPSSLDRRLQQLTLDLRPEVQPTLANFIVGPNQALLAALRRQRVATDGSWLYVWGAPGSGRSHLLQAIVSESLASGRSSAYMPADSGGDWLLEQGQFLALDDVDQLDAPGQAALFRALIQAPAAQASLVLAGHAPPQQLSLREDVRTRIGQALVFEIQALSDADQGALLIEHASARGMRLEAELVEYLLRHGRRDQAWQMRVLDAVDAVSLSQSRPITLPLLREILHHECEPELPFDTRPA